MLFGQVDPRKALEVVESELIDNTRQTLALTLLCTVNANVWKDLVEGDVVVKLPIMQGNISESRQPLALEVVE